MFSTTYADWAKRMGNLVFKSKDHWKIYEMPTENDLYTHLSKLYVVKFIIVDNIDIFAGTINLCGEYGDSSWDLVQQKCKDTPKDVKEKIEQLKQMVLIASM